jgi:biotin carboxyl carrier protein
MNVEIPINSNYKGKIKEILVKKGDMIDEDETVIILE